MENLNDSLCNKRGMPNDFVNDEAMKILTTTTTITTIVLPLATAPTTTILTTAIAIITTNSDQVNVGQIGEVIFNEITMGSE